MYKQHALIILMLLAVLAILSACGAPPTPQTIERIVTQVVEKEVTTVVEKQVTTVVEKERVVEVTPTAAPLPKGAVRIIPFLSNESDPESVKVFQAVFEEFSAENPDISIDLVLGTHGDIGQRVIAAASVGAELGVIQVRPFEMEDFIQAGYLLPLDDVVEAIGVDNFKPGTIIRGADGHVYALAYAGGTHGTLWVRNDQLDAVGLEPPKTYEELLAAAQAMTRDTDSDGKIDIYGIGLPAGPDAATSARFISFVYQNCGDYFDREGILVFDQPQVLEAVKRYVALLEYAPPGFTGWSWFDGIDAFSSGRVAMHPYGGRLGVNLERAAPDIRANSSVIFFPAGEKVKAVRGGFDYLAVYSGVRHPDAAKKFLEFFFTGDRLARFELTVPGHLIPPTEDMAQTILKSDHEYVQKYKNDVETLFSVANYNADPIVNMGAVDPDTCEFNPTLNPMPWGGAIFSRKPPIDAEMIQRIVVNKEPVEDAWKWAYTEMQKVADEWKAANPDWKPGK
ncbi:MAG: extracellular solute-binding protein [Ardenticatenaceae bacterium]|nr:extracellular solute-binding protein [Ardenticatenaceae bacterium]